MSSEVNDEAGRLSGLAFSGLALSGLAGLSGLSLSPPESDSVVDGAAGLGLAAKDKTTFSDVSSRLRPSSTAGGVVDEEGSDEEEGPASVAALSICSAINSLSLCSSLVVARSFSCSLQL